MHIGDSNCDQSEQSSKKTHVAHLYRIPVPDLTFQHQRFEVRSPCVTRPAQNLHEELAVCFERCSQSALWRHLHVHVPLVLDNPARHELIITGDELIPACSRPLQHADAQSVASVRTLPCAEAHSNMQSHWGVWVNQQIAHSM